MYLSTLIAVPWKTCTAPKVSKYRVFSGPYFSVFSPNTGKYRPEKTPYLDIFYGVLEKEVSHLAWKSFFCDLKVLSTKLYNKKYVMALTKITSTEIFTFIAVLFISSWVVKFCL